MSTWILCIFVFLFFAAITTLFCFAILGISKRRDISLSTLPAQACSASVSSIPSTPKTGFMDTVFGILGIAVLVVVLFFMGASAYKFYKWLRTPSSPTTVVVVQQQAVYATNCYTPCTLHRDRNQSALWDLGVPMKIRVDGGRWVTYQIQTKGAKEVSTQALPPGWTDFDSPSGSIRVDIVNN